MVSKDVDSESMLVVTVCERKSSTALKGLEKIHQLQGLPSSSLT